MPKPPLLKTILVPLDGSSLAESALPCAARIARVSGATLVLMHAVAPATGNLMHADLVREAIHLQRALKQRARQELCTMAGRLREAESITVDMAVDVAEPASGILELAQRVGAGLIVMSTHGRSGLGRWLYGSVADEVIRHADIPVLLLPPNTASPWPEQQALRILVALDGSPLAAEALGPAGELAGALNAELTLLRVVEPPYYVSAESPRLIEFDPQDELARAWRYLDGVAANLRSQGRSVLFRVASGEAAATIASVAHESGVHAIALATHGSGGLVRLLVGSVTMGVLRRAGLPLLLVRPSGLAGQQTAEASAAARA